jgi:hypothetical protein
MEVPMSSPATNIDGDSIEFRAPKSTNWKAAAKQVFAAIRDGLTSMHQYEDLRARGASHGAAAKKACAFNS